MAIEVATSHAPVTASSTVFEPRIIGFLCYWCSYTGADLAGVISDCYEVLGRRKTIDLLDGLNRIGFRQATLSGLSFATDDLITPPNKSKIIANAEICPEA